MRPSWWILPFVGLVALPRARADGVNELDASLAYFRAQVGYNAVGALGVGYRGVGYGYALTRWLELSIRVRFSASANDDQTQGETVFEATAGPTFNFGGASLASDFFVSLGAGANYTQINSIIVPGTLYTTGGLYSTNPTFSFEIGKRFQVFPNVSLKPSFLITQMIGADIIDGASNASPAFSINPVEISITF